MNKLSFILLFLLYCFNTLQADGYVSYHFTNLGGTFNPSLSDEVNICVLDNGTTSNCLDKYPSILSNTYHDNGSISGTSNDVKDNDTRYFDEKIRIGLSTIRLSAGLGANFFEGTIIGIGTRYGFTTGIVSIEGKKNKTILEGNGPLFGFEFEIYTLHDKLSFFGFFPFYRQTYFLSESNIYVLGENKNGKYFVRDKYKIISNQIDYGGSFKIPFVSMAGTKKGKGNVNGLFIDLYRNLTYSNLKILDHTLKMKSHSNGYSLKYSFSF